jgi:hypothetical protein
MKRMLCLLTLLSGATVCGAAGWTSELTVPSAFTENSDLVVVYTVDAGVYTPGCVADAWIFRADTDARRGRGYATVLTALATGKKIRFWFNDICSTWNFHDATAVMLVNR